MPQSSRFRRNIDYNICQWWKQMSISTPYVKFHSENIADTIILSKRVYRSHLSYRIITQIVSWICMVALVHLEYDTRHLKRCVQYIQYLWDIKSDMVIVFVCQNYITNSIFCLCIKTHRNKRKYSKRETKMHLTPKYKLLNTCITSFNIW